uniref:Histidine triad nucleotide-binding protein 3 n=1 Tax=Rhizophora mucronata TaxID=61149 RepID=A0A2P2KJR9_RHIMU
MSYSHKSRAFSKTMKTMIRAVCPAEIKENYLLRLVCHIIIDVKPLECLKLSQNFIIGHLDCVNIQKAREARIYNLFAIALMSILPNTRRNVDKELSFGEHENKKHQIVQTQKVKIPILIPYKL